MATALGRVERIYAWESTGFPSVSFKSVTPQPELWSPLQGGLPVAEGGREESGFCSRELMLGRLK